MYPFPVLDGRRVYQIRIPFTSALEEDLGKQCLRKKCIRERKLGLGPCSVLLQVRGGLGTPNPRF